MKLLIINNTEQAITYTSTNPSTQIPGNSEIEITSDANIIRLCTDDNLWKDLADGKITCGDGEATFSRTQGLKEMVKVISLKQLDTPRDSDGSPLQRTKITTTGWKAQFHVIRISTATTNGVRNKKKDGTDLGFCTYKMYASDGSETNTPSLAVKTVVTWEPNHDMEIVGGDLFQSTPPTTDVWMYVTAAAHIPAAYGGSIAFLEGGMNLADVGIGGGVSFDGKSPKWIAYDSTNHSGRFEIELQHNAGVQHSFSLSFNIYRP